MGARSLINRAFSPHAGMTELGPLARAGIVSGRWPSNCRPKGWCVPGQTQPRTGSRDRSSVDIPDDTGHRRQVVVAVRETALIDRERTSRELTSSVSPVGVDVGSGQRHAVGLSNGFRSSGICAVSRTATTKSGWYRQGSSPADDALPRARRCSATERIASERAM